MIDKEHLNYERHMLLAVYDRLCNSYGIDIVTFNAFHESFCVHAYNIFTYYAKNFKNTKVKLWKRLIEEQVLTLTNKRTVVMSEKIGTLMRAEMVKMIEEKL